MIVYKIILTVLSVVLATNLANGAVRNRRKAVTNVECVGEGKYYRDPKGGVNGHFECSKYYLCIGDEVFEFKCTSGLLFDVQRQICDFKFNVDNCHLTNEATTPRPLLVTEEPVCPLGELACGDGKCRPKEMFCDDVVDCDDGSDEGYCDINNDPNGAQKCDPKNCSLPNCFCSSDGTKIPGNLDPKQVPQMIILTFDDAVNFQNWDLYKELFGSNRNNTNGCPIRATFYISHEYSNYHYIQQLWNDGHEIAVHSITHKQPERWWTQNATLEDWFDEFVGQANILNKFAGIPMEELRGMRVPFLRIGWNRQFTMMKEFGFVYDSTMVAPASNPPLWPYTLDYRMPHSCQGAEQRCPSRSYPGIWEMVMNQLQTEATNCAMVDSCPKYDEEEEVYQMLISNFKRHYDTNRAPLGLYFHTVWFFDDVNKRAFLKFVDEMVSKEDVWFVTNNQAIEWMRKPTPIDELKDFKPWQCFGDRIDPADKACSHAKACKLTSKVLPGDRYLHTCFTCPNSYPWLRNEFGQD
ncbi:hypothetical protein CHUAL_011671 [Chamberlinius hualienensis]